MLTMAIAAQGVSYDDSLWIMPRGEQLETRSKLLEPFDDEARLF